LSVVLDFDSMIVNKNLVDKELEEKTKKLQASGRLQFPGIQKKQAQYLILKSIEKNDQNLVRSVIEYLYASWEFERPELIITVTGGARKFPLSARMKKAFKNGISKLAASTRTLIISG
jgi:hypothetical protein